jgi:hypothetical protein
MQAAKFITFAEIIQGRDLSVSITDDGMIYAVDLAIVVTGKSRDDAARAIRDLPEEIGTEIKSPLASRKKSPLARVSVHCLRFRL